MSAKNILLVVEDDLDVREAILDSLASIDAEIVTADNGRMGLEKVLSIKPTAILSDINMPIMNGLEFLAEVRKNGFDTPFVVLSAFADKQNTVKALRMGAFDFLDKPFDINELEAVVNKALNLGVHLKALEAQLDELKKSKNLSEEQVTKLKESKKHIMMMRFDTKKTA